MKKNDSLDSQEINRLYLYFYLVPVIGFFPALWALYRHQGNRQQQTVSRLAVMMALLWLIGAILFTSSGQIAEPLQLRLVIANSLFTSGYFLVNLWLMFRLFQGKRVYLPGISPLAERVTRKYLP